MGEHAEGREADSRARSKTHEDPQPRQPPRLRRAAATWRAGLIMIRPTLLFGCAVLLLSSAARGAGFEVLPRLQPLIRVPVPAPQEFAARVSARHPRLILTEDRRAAIRALLQTSEVARGWLATVRRNAAYYESLPVIDYVPEKPGEHAQVVPMLFPGRELVDRIYTLGLVAILDQDEKSFDRLRREVLHAIDGWPDWQTGLARYEIAAGMGDAYDWFYARWTEAERTKIRGALVNRALRPYVAEYAGFTKPSALNGGMVRNNVNLVCNAGVSVAALAVVDEAPAVAGEVLSEAFAFLQVALPGYGDDGAWFEGISYWIFGTRHLVQLLASWDTACGTDFGLVSANRFPGFAHTAEFPIYLTSPTGRAFNFADAPGGVTFSCASLLWLGATYQQPLAIAYEEKQTSGDTRGRNGKPLHETAREVVQRLLYYRPVSNATAADAAPPALDKIYRDTGVVTLRSSWQDPNGTFLGLKAGSAAGNRHAHLDAGTVIVDALGQRWLSELGSGPYEAAYFHEERFRFFQARTEGHNTLLINPQGPAGGNQFIPGHPTIGELQSTPAAVSCAVDLTPVYPDAANVSRTVELKEGRRVVRVVDEVTLKEPGRVRWHFYTEAPIIIPSPDGRRITLKFAGNLDPHAGSRMEIALQSPDAALKFLVEPAAPLPGGSVLNPGPVKGFTRLAIESPPGRTYHLAVELRPHSEP